MTPIDPEMCINTGRLMTEWFEYPEYTDEQVRSQAYKSVGLPEDHKFDDLASRLPPEQQSQLRAIQGIMNSHKRRKWKHNMTQQEVAARMNEATKMISPDNYKFLDDETRKRTGLEINPLWMMECLVRSGVLAPKEQIGALKELAGYTHSKAPSINHNTNTNLSPEDWLLELAKDEYKVIDEVKSFQPMQIVERGAGIHYQNRMKRRAKTTQALSDHSSKEFDEMAAMIDAEFIEVDN